MVFKIENSEITIDGKSIAKTIILSYMVVKLYKAIYNVGNENCTMMVIPMKQMNNKQKISKKLKVES